MEKLELQILSGLHSGARHLLSRKRFTIGGDDDADLRLLDESFEGALLHLETLESGALAVSADAVVMVFDDAGRPARDAGVLAVGGFLKMGDVWIALCPAGGLLAKVPSIIAVEPDADTDPMALEGFSFEGAHHDEMSDEDDLQHDFNHDRERSTRSLRRKAAAGFVGGVMAILVVGLGVAWMPSEAHTSTPAAVSQSKAPPAAAASLSSVSAVSASAAISPPVAPVTTTPPAPVALGVAPTSAAKAESSLDQQARQWLTETLQDQGLASLITARVSSGEITLGGKLDRSELRDFEKLLPEIEARLGQQYRIKAHIEPASTGPTFRIREVVLGKDGWIVTDLGQRVLVGGTIDGYRLMGIEGNKVIFMGASRVEIQI